MILSVFTDELGMDVAQALPVIESWGMQHVDLRGQVFRKGCEFLTPAELTRLRKLLEGHGMQVACLQSSLAKVHLPEAERLAAEAEKLDGIIRAADALDCRLVRSFFFWQPDEAQRGNLAVQGDLMQRVLDAFGPLADRAAEAGLVLAFENCGVTTAEVLAVLDAFGRPTWGLAWDVANEWFAGDLRAADEDAYIQRLAPRTRCVHVKATGMLPDLGDLVPWDRVLQALDNHGLRGPVSIETHNPVPDAVTGADQSKRVFDALKRAWPSAAPSTPGETGPDFAAVTRDYEPVGFVVVGLGMGHARAKDITQTSGAHLVGVVDTDPDRAARTGEELGVPHTADLAPWLDSAAVEVVYVLTPTGRHAEVALDALAAGKHVLLTKPMEASLDACDAMIRLADEKGLLLAVDFDRRFNTDVLAMRAAVRSGRLGRILGGEIVLKVLRTMAYFEGQGGWRGTRRLDGGGVLSNQCIHNIDEVAFILGVPRRVRCEIRTQNHRIEAEDLGCALWEYDHGAVISLFATTSYPHPTWYRRMELHGTEGAIANVGGGPVENPQTRYFLDGAWSDQAPETGDLEYVTAADNIAAALRTGAPLVCDGRDARRTQAILDAMYRSACGNRDWVEVEAELPRSRVLSRGGSGEPPRGNPPHSTEV